MKNNTKVKGETAPNGDLNVPILDSNRDIGNGQPPKQAEPIHDRELLRTVIDNLPDSIYVKDTAARKTLANKINVRNSGCKTEGELIGKTDFDFFPEAMAKKTFEDDQMVLQKGQSVINREEKLTNASGEVFWLLTTKVPWRDETGKIIGLVGIGRNITAMKESEAKLDQVRKQLMEASRQAGMAEIATSVLHNVGNVLNSVNVASSCVAESLKKSKAASLSKVVALLREHESDLGNFFANDPKGKQLPGFLSQLAGQLAAEQATALDELAFLQKNIEHIKEIVAMQQNYASSSGVEELVSVIDLVEDASA